MFGALAEFERNLVRERTQAGLNAARARGRKSGRPKVLEPAKRPLVVKLYAEKKHTIGEICQDDGDLETDALQLRRRSQRVTCGAGVPPTRRW
jgi:DNA invertase Pin-like site-specific DNA recombinase